MPVTLRSYSKINLGLAIGPARPDGFHALTTLYQTLDVHDLLTVTVAPLAPSQLSSIEISCNHPWVPLDERNTTWKMLERALAAPGREQLRVQAKVHIEKRLPVQGGLGAGSANAAVTLLGLERELVRQGLAMPLTGDERLRVAAEVGSDVPLFLLGGAVLGTGRGEQVVPMPDLSDATALATEPLYVVLALPSEGVSTPAAFRAWDADQAARGLTPAGMTDRLMKLSRALASAWTEQHATGVLDPGKAPKHHEGSGPGNQGLAGTLLSTLVQTGILLNDFEQVVFRQHPHLRQIQRALAGEPAGGFAALSGSGSAMFGLYTGSAAADAAEERLNVLGTRTMRARVQTRAAYWAGMVLDG